MPPFFQRTWITLRTHKVPGILRGKSLDDIIGTNSGQKLGEQDVKQSTIRVPASKGKEGRRYTILARAARRQTVTDLAIVSGL